MHALAAYELARIRIDELHAEADRDRLAATARRPVEGPDPRASTELHRPSGLLRRLLARLAPSASGA